MPNPRSGPWCCEGQAGILQRGAAAGREAAVPSCNPQRAEGFLLNAYLYACVCIYVHIYVFQEMESSFVRNGRSL